MVLAGGDQVGRSELLGILPEVAGDDAGPEPRARGDARCDPGGGPGTDPARPTVLRPVPARAPKGQSDRLGALVRLIEERGSISTQDYVAASGLSKRTALRDLTQLVDSGVVARTGKRRAARYVIREAAVDGENAVGETEAAKLGGAPVSRRTPQA